MATTEQQTKLTEFVLGDADERFMALDNDQHWNGYSCPLFTLEQVTLFLEILNKDPDFKAKMEGDLAVIHIHSSDEYLSIQAINGFYEFSGWCFQKAIDERVK
jgi:hypothetical protein